MRYCWVEEIEKWLPSLPPGSIKVVRSGKDVSGLRTNSVTIVTYGLMQQADFSAVIRYSRLCGPSIASIPSSVAL